MSNTVGRVTCNRCKRVFQNGEEWAKNTTCDIPEECRCPEIEKTMRRAQQAITKAKDTSGYKVIRQEATIPTNRDETQAQLYVDVAPLLRVEIIKLPQRGGKGKNVS